MNKTYLIVYHLEDNDGCSSAALIKYYLVNELHVPEKNIKLFPATYAILNNVLNSDFYYIDENYCKVNILDFDYFIMTDISFNDFEGMKIIYDTYGSNFIWIDHHAPIIKESIKQEYDIKINGIRDTSRSAILNTYKYCYDPLDIAYLNGNAPLVLRYLSAWDSWSISQENLDFDKTRNINTGFTSESKLAVDYWYDLMPKILENDKANIDALLLAMEDRGRKINEAMDKRCEELVKNCGIGGFTVNGNKSCIIVFTSGPTSSLIFKSVRGQYDNAVCFKSSSTGNVTISLYNVIDTHDFHCGEYLKNKYNGGGHEGAAGATISFDTFCEILKTKQI